MNVSLNWLNAIAPSVGDDAHRIAERLASLGFPVEEIQHLAEGLDDIVVARVLEVSPHPNADRLRVCRVEGGQGEVQVVCGATNVAAGGWYPFAPVGATLPGGVAIRKAKLRGEVSEGMLCSERELGLGRDHEGIMALEGNFTPGQPFVEALALADTRLDVEVTSNRPDLLSHLGVARELVDSGDGSLSLPVIPGESEELAAALAAVATLTDSREVSAGGVTIRIEDTKRCPRYLGLVIRGVTVGPSPRWLQNRLRAAGSRPINNVVDATNYVLLELGQPLHAFDLDRLADHTVVVRRATEGEPLRTLDGVDRKLSSETLAICDARRPAAVGGVLGGEESEVRDDTRDLLLECALFAPGPVRATRKALGLSTDASYRFERGVDPEGMHAALLRVARIILATAGGTLSGPILEVNAAPFTRKTVPLRPSRVERVLGVPFTAEAISTLLTPLGFQVGAPEGEALPVEVPGYRSYDVTREVDLIEEIARRHGFDNFPDDLGAFRPGTVPDDPFLILEDGLRDHLVAAGFFEAQTPAFAGEGEGEVELQNPISREEGYLRSTLLPSLLRRVEYNLARGNREVRLFELGTSFGVGGAGAPPEETPHLALAFHGHRAPPHWTGSAERWDLWDLKGLLEGIGARVWGAGTTVLPDGEGRLALHAPDGTAVGSGGGISPDALDLPPWADTVWGAEIALPAPPPAREVVRYRPIPTHPAMERDLALLLPEGVPAREVEALLAREGGEHFRSSRVFDVYRGDGIPAGTRSVAFRLHFRAPDRTLQEDEVDPTVKRIVRTLKEELGVELRGAQS